MEFTAVKCKTMSKCKSNVNELNETTSINFQVTSVMAVGRYIHNQLPSQSVGCWAFQLFIYFESKNIHHSQLIQHNYLGVFANEPTSAQLLYRHACNCIFIVQLFSFFCSVGVFFCHLTHETRGLTTGRFSRFE